MRQRQFENENRIRLAGGILDPAVIVVIGIIVVMIVFFILQRIVDINNLLRVWPAVVPARQSRGSSRNIGA